MKDVLGQAEPDQTAGGKKTIALPLSQRLNVGAKLAEARAIAIDAASKLSALVDEETAHTLKILVRDLENRVCRIAFVGQMNAGKSSLINVLVEQAELLPADINPWTTVITNLHFGTPGSPTSGASFTFFTLDEWQRLSIGGRTRELTERLFPDFDWAALNNQVEAMRKRAEKKLGPRFEELLGTEHTYPAITAGLLNRYVGAGHPESSGQETQSEGEFSDITKVANVYFDLGAFNFPAILVDTPGVNDPFLVRDEITRQNLQAADICVIVLTARQPLSNADLSLLRMLRGLNKSRLVIFVNKVDEIEGGEEVMREVAQRITAVLQREFPPAHVPIVFGSAFWARTALFPQAFRDGLYDDAAGQAGTESVRIPGLPSHDEIADTVTAETFFLRSGLSSLAVAISEMMGAGTVADAIKATNSLVEAVCRNSIACLETEIALLSQSISEPASAANAASSLKILEGTLAAELDVFSDKLAQIYMQRVTELHQRLAATVQSSAGEMLAAMPENTSLAHLGQIDMRLRLKLENAFLAAFQIAEKSVLAEQEKLREVIASLIEGSPLHEKFTLIVSGKLSVDTTPSLAALSEPAALDLASSLGEHAPQLIPPEEQNAYLSSVIVADFEPIVASLADEAARALNEMSVNILTQMRTLTLRPLELTALRISDHISALQEGGAPAQSLEHELEIRHEAIAKLRLILAGNASAFPTPYVKN